jgi:hypothetical protein
VFRQLSYPQLGSPLDRHALRREDEKAAGKILAENMQSVSMINLVLSLVFGLGQIVVGAVLVVHGWNRWRRVGVFLLMLAGAWFVCSGMIELFVSGMESLQHISGMPNEATFHLWRGRADTALAVATGVIVAAGLVAGVSGRLSWRRD